jgi:HEAT repeat protein
VTIWSPSYIVRLLEMPFEDTRPLKRQLANEVPTPTLILAFEEATRPRTRWLLCDVLGMQRDALALPILLASLEDESTTLRAIAAEALGRLGVSEAGPALLARFSDPNEDVGVRRAAGSALGAVGHRPAVAALAAALSDDDAGLRASAALSLGLLRDPAAIEALKAALARETEWFPQRRILDALANIGE